MKKNIILFAALTMMVMASCNNNPTNENTSTPPSPQPERTTVVVDTPKDGTTIKVGNDGVSFESKDGSKKSSVKISADSSKIEISTPK